MRTSDEAAVKVRQLLFDGGLKPGDRLPAERELCVMLGVSRPALREALRGLEAGGLLEMRAGKHGGAFITRGRESVVSAAISDLLQLASISIGELFEARQWIQGALVRVACERLTDAQLDELEANVSAADRAHQAGNYEERIRLNIEFHGLLAQGTGNAVAAIVVRGLSEAWRVLIREVGSDQVAGSVTYRRELLKALRARDEEAAAKAMAKILRTSEALYKTLAKRRAEALIAQTPTASASREPKAGTAAKRPRQAGAAKTSLRRP